MTGPVPLLMILTNSVGTRMELLVVLIPVKYESSFPSCSTSWTISSVEHDCKTCITDTYVYGLEYVWFKNISLRTC